MKICPSISKLNWGFSRPYCAHVWQIFSVAHFAPSNLGSNLSQQWLSETFSIAVFPFVQKVLNLPDQKLSKEAVGRSRHCCSLSLATRGEKQQPGTQVWSCTWQLQRGGGQRWSERNTRGQRPERGENRKSCACKSLFLQLLIITWPSKVAMSFCCY